MTDELIQYSFYILKIFRGFLGAQRENAAAGFWWKRKLIDFFIRHFGLGLLVSKSLRVSIEFGR